ncbi:HD domain-containing protein [Mucilaginibacter achroorhodeus]|uniref:HD domain-containing protein n=1 Tax=Mucilaginibacter achroorhodeus TaxID=2599294 RepID=A0A563U707_9SPHI|nr:MULTISPECIES: Pycsar system effector family protein [Mucilaginibacter]QXV64977.1 HD domain-containing protein [Mucilaginibacter sp. 21P]TWR27128.1 HD domain-containing protein [Mucilaginibacter achroorhodeus]
MSYTGLLHKVKDYALLYYKTHADDRLVYHNIEHTENMLTAATQIGNHYQLDERKFFIIHAAAWFHDLGYMVDMQRHEEEGAKLAANFLKQYDVDPQIIGEIEGCIIATQMPQSPKTELEKIVCDADLFHLGTDDFFKTDKQLLKELSTVHGIEMSKNEWRKKSIRFLEAHQYHTDYCNVLLNSGKQKNIQILKDKLAAYEAKHKLSPGTLAPQPQTHHEVEIEEPKKKKKEDRPDKGIETMFRISSGNHQRLSDMADNKAHIMITVNSIILSAIISLLLRKLTEYEYLIIPTFILLAVSLLAMTFSILSTRPSIPKGTFQRDDVDQKRVNLLFFGNFYKMSLDDYTYGMVKMMEDKDFLYGSLIRDVYAQGVVLGKKYRLLRNAYNIFMFGLIIAVLAFVIAATVNNAKDKH